MFFLLMSSSFSSSKVVSFSGAVYKLSLHHAYRLSLETPNFRLGWERKMYFWFFVQLPQTSWVNFCIFFFFFMCYLYLNLHSIDKLLALLSVSKMLWVLQFLLQFFYQVTFLLLAQRDFVTSMPSFPSPLSDGLNEKKTYSLWMLKQLSFYIEDNVFLQTSFK